MKQLSLVLNFITLDQFLLKKKTHQKKVMIDCNIQETGLGENRMKHVPKTLPTTERTYKINVLFNRYMNFSRNFNRCSKKLFLDISSY